MASVAAERCLLAIGWQESRWRWRRQRGGGPARGFLQFEPAGVRGVITHPSSRPIALSVLRTLWYPTDPIEAAVEAAWMAMEHNDVLCVAFGRLSHSRSCLLARGARRVMSRDRPTPTPGPTHGGHGRR